MFNKLYIHIAVNGSFSKMCTKHDMINEKCSKSKQYCKIPFLFTYCYFKPSYLVNLRKDKLHKLINININNKFNFTALLQQMFEMTTIFLNT